MNRGENAQDHIRNTTQIWAKEWDIIKKLGNWLRNRCVSRVTTAEKAADDFAEKAAPDPLPIIVLFLRAAEIEGNTNILQYQYRDYTRFSHSVAAEI